MARLTAEMRTDAFLSAHPVIQGSYAHYSFVVIHPFADGNGRVARALASAFTYRAISMPIVILSEHRDDYLSALEASDAGDFQQFVDFMLARSLDTVVLVEESLRSATAPPAEQSAAAIERLYFTKGGYTYEQVDQFGERLLNAFNEAVIPLIQKGQNSKITFGTALTQMRYETPEAYRTPLSGGRGVNLSLQTAGPTVTRVNRAYALLLPRDAGGEDDVQLISPQGAGVSDVFIARVDQLTPSISGMLQIRINMLAERLVNEMYAELLKQSSQLARKF